MRINELFDELKKINLAESEANDRGQGLEPLLQEFVYEVSGLPEEARVRRTRLISDYYNTIYNRSHRRVPVAYSQTRKWAMKTFVQHWIDKTVDSKDPQVDLFNESVDTAVDEKEKHFEERTRMHIGLVQKSSKKIAEKYPEFVKLPEIAEEHDASKFEDPEHAPYVSLTWKMRQGHKNKTPGEIGVEDENEATMHHIKNNAHHPEYWLEDKGEANIDPEDRSKSKKCVDASEMPDIAVAEMVSDWQAMSEELKKNTAREWFEKQKDVRWHFSKHQVELIDKLLKVFEDEKVSESAIDFPKDELPSDIWAKKDEKYFLKPGIKEKVLKYIKSYPGKDLTSIAKEIHVCGSLATNLYTQYSDFDVHIVLDQKKVTGKQKQEELVKEVGDWSEENPDEIAGHPCQIYIQLNQAQDYVGDSAWHLIDEFWVKGPKVTKLNFNPYTYYKDILDEVAKKSKDCDVKLGELSRSVIDYASIKSAFKSIPKSGKESLRKLMKTKLRDIEGDIESLTKYKKEWVKKRRSVSQPKTIQQAVTDKRMQEEWERANAVFKFLAKYDYLLTIKALEDILEDDDVLDDEDVHAIAKVLDVHNDFDKVSPDLTNKEKIK